MMRYLLLALLLVGSLYADSLRVNLTADTYIYENGNTASGSFVIWGNTSAAATDVTYLNGTAANQWYNYGAATTAAVGKVSSAERNMLLRFPGLDDTMRVYAPTGKIVVWDSARVTLCISGFPGTADSLKCKIIGLASGRNWAEGSSTGAVAGGASWANYDTLLGTAYPWSTAGGLGSSDTAGGILDSTGWIAPATPSDSLVTFKVPSYAVSDTMKKTGLIIGSLRYGTGTSSATSQSCTFVTDDNANSWRRPKIQVYYTTYEPDFGAADTLLAKSTIPATRIARPIFKFDPSSIDATWDLDSVVLHTYISANYSDNTEGSITVEPAFIVKPINIGTGTGGATATGKLHYYSWYENGSSDSAWTTAGIGDDGYVCNRSTATGDDRTPYQSNYGEAWTGTGWKRMGIDTLGLRTYLDGGCSDLGIVLTPLSSITDDAWFILESKDNAGTNETTMLVYYHTGAVAATKGTGRFGRGQNGAYLNVR